MKTENKTEDWNWTEIWVWIKIWCEIKSCETDFDWAFFTRVFLLEALPSFKKNSALWTSAKMKSVEIDWIWADEVIRIDSKKSDSEKEIKKNP